MRGYAPFFFFNDFRIKPVYPEPARVWVCLLKLTPQLLNQGSAVLRFCLSSLNK